MNPDRPPFRAEHIGSLLRPQRLLDARAAIEGDQYRKATESTLYGQLSAIEDAAIRDAVRLQEEVGLRGVIQRLTARENLDVNNYWLCDRGRFDTKFVTSSIDPSSSNDTIPPKPAICCRATR